MSNGVQLNDIEQQSSEDSWTDAEEYNESEEQLVNYNHLVRTPSLNSGPVDFLGEGIHARSISSPQILSRESFKRSMSSPRRLASEAALRKHIRSSSGDVKYMRSSSGDVKYVRSSSGENLIHVRSRSGDQIKPKRRTHSPQILNSTPKYAKSSPSSSFHRSISRQNHRPSTEDIKQLTNQLHNRSLSRQSQHSRQSDTGGSSLGILERSSNSLGPHCRASHSLSAGASLTTNSSATLHQAFHDLQKLPKEELLEHHHHRIPSVPQPLDISNADEGGDYLIRNLDTGEFFYYDDRRLKLLWKALH